jgi:hypothetical protein
VSFLKEIPQRLLSKETKVTKPHGAPWVKKQTSWRFHVDDRSISSSTYDMIIGRDLLGELGIILNFNEHTVTWDRDTIPM